jgi:cytochrome P450
MTLRERLQRRVAEPAVLRWCQWRGDLLASLMGAQAKADPYPLYAAVRARGLTRSRLGAWMTASHGAAEAILRDGRFSSSPVHQRGYRPRAYPEGDPRAGLPESDMLTMDPPDHTRIRRLVASGFTPRSVAAMEPWIRDTARELLDRADGAAGFDLIDALAFPLPIAVICRLLGVPSGDQARFRAWGHAIAGTLEPQLTLGEETRKREAELALTAYLRDLADRRRAGPDGSVLSALAALEEDGDQLTAGELVSTALLLLVAGFETTVNLIGNGTVALLQAPGQWERLGGDPALVPGAVEELLRYDSPVQLTSRTATVDTEVEGTLIPKGETVLVLIGGANRDPAVFSQPDRLLISRPDASRHLSFSLGIHHCLGAALARLEGRVAFEELTSRYPRLELAGTPVRRPLLVLRGYEAVPVRSRRLAPEGPERGPEHGPERGTAQLAARTTASRRARLPDRAHRPDARSRSRLTFAMQIAPSPAGH